MCCEGHKGIKEDSQIFPLEQLDKYKLLFIDMGKTTGKIHLGRRNQEFYNKCVKFKMPTRQLSGDSMEAVGYITVVIDTVKKKSKASH